MTVETTRELADRLVIPDNLDGGEIRIGLLSLVPSGVGVRWLVGQLDDQGYQPAVDLTIRPRRLELLPWGEMVEDADGKLTSWLEEDKYTAELEFSRRVKEFETWDRTVEDHARIELLTEGWSEFDGDAYLAFAQRALDELSRRRDDADIAAFFAVDVKAIAAAELERIYQRRHHGGEEVTQ
jgi:hypothetical protein